MAKYSVPFRAAVKDALNERNAAGDAGKCSAESAIRDRAAAIAESFDCLIEDDFCLLAGIEPGTAQSWRKRGIGPSYILLGNRYLYPRSAVAYFMKSKIRERKCGGLVEGL
jgi:hypothetical protein